MRAVLDFDTQAAGEEIAPVVLANRSSQIHLSCSRRHQAWRQSERRYLLRRLRSVIVDLGRDRPPLHDRS